MPRSVPGGVEEWALEFCFLVVGSPIVGDLQIRRRGVVEVGLIKTKRVCASVPGSGPNRGGKESKKRFFCVLTHS
jgi:hypothetical protein